MDPYIAKMRQGSPPERASSLGCGSGAMPMMGASAIWSTLTLQESIEAWPGGNQDDNRRSNKSVSCLTRLRPWLYDSRLAERTDESADSGSGTSSLGALASENDSWTQVNVNRYPSRRVVQELLSWPRYLQIMACTAGALTRMLIVLIRDAVTTWSRLFC